VTLLEHFIRWKEPLETLQFAAALALTVGALVLFQIYSHRLNDRRARCRALRVEIEEER